MKFGKSIVIVFCFCIICINATVATASTPGDSTLFPQIEKLNDLAFSLRKSDPVKALSYSEKSLSLSIQYHYKTGEINALLVRGMVFKNVGAYDKSIDAYLQALRLAEESKDSQRISSCLNNIGSVFQAQGNFSKALSYYLRSLKMEETLDDQGQLSIRYYNIGTVYESLDSMNLAYAYYQNSLLIEEKLGNKEGIYYALYGIAGIETRLGRFESAMANISRALKVARELDDALGMSVCHTELGKLYLAQGKLDQAIASFDSTVYFAKPANLLNELKEGYFNLSEAWEKRGDRLKAYDFLHKYVVLNDSLNNIGIKSRVAELEARFEVEWKEKEIDNLKELNTLSAEKADSERRNRNFLLITTLLAMLLAVYNLRRISVDLRKTLALAAGILVFIILLSLAVLFFSNTDTPPHLNGFFNAFADVLTYSVLPIFILILLAERVLLKRYLKKAGEINEQIQNLVLPEEHQKLNLQFEGKEQELILDQKDIICFEANDNYTAIYYSLNGKVKKDLKRITLKKVEEQLVEISDFVRCHKSYIINLGNVSHISGNAQGYKLHLQMIDFSIPVSRNFPQSMIEKIKSRK
jgi:tetratricopeptide (TPR) repeat protein